MKVTLILTAVLLIPAIGSASDIYVPDDWPTIQIAIDNAYTGDTIIVRPGTYVENIDFLGKWITLRSEFGPTATVIDGNQAGSVVTFQNGEDYDTVLDGFTITNGDAGSGGGINCQYAYPKILNNIITGNNGYYGGGLYGFVCDADIIGNIFHANTAVAGGGLCIQWSSPWLWNNIISENSSAWSGGIEFYGSYGVVRSCTICRNTASNQGGGLYCWGASDVFLTNTIFWGNSAPDGKEIWIGKTASPSTLDIAHSDVEGGQASVYVDPGCTLNWGAGMIDDDPLFVDAAGNDFHLTLPSPCRDAGDNNAGMPATDFEGDPRIALGTVDIGADEFYYHLYYMGDALPGGAIDIRIIGYPLTLVTLAWGQDVVDPPISTQYGDLYIYPFIWTGDVGTVSTQGVLSVPFTVPPGWPSGFQTPLQALVGPLGWPSARLTNLMMLTIN